MELIKLLLEHAEADYADFEHRLSPTIPRERCLGVRVPALRALAKDYCKTAECTVFLASLPHTYYDENLLHSILLSEEKDYPTAIRQVEAFLPYVDNWAACDTLSPKCFRKHRAELLERIPGWIASPLEYTCRFGMEILMNHFLDTDFRPEFLELPAAVHREEYYVRMMQAWFYATALTKQWDAALPCLTEGRLEPWVHNKTIQKARESFRIPEERKEFLKTLRRNAAE